MSPGPNSNLHPDDEKLLEDDTHAPQVDYEFRTSSFAQTLPNKLFFESDSSG